VLVSAGTGGLAVTTVARTTANATAIVTIPTTLCVAIFPFTTISSPIEALIRDNSGYGTI